MCFIVSLFVLLSLSESLLEALDLEPDRRPWVDSRAGFQESDCALPSALVAEIQSYQSTADAIFKAVTRKPFKGKAYAQLEYLADIFGPRLSGSPALEQLIDYAMNHMKEQGLQNVQEEKVQVPHVLRGHVVGKMTRPRLQTLSVTATGFSAPTLGLTALILLIRSLKYLLANKDKVRGKIAVFDFQVDDFEQREFVLAEEAGGVAVMSRSLVSLSIYSLTVRAGSPKLRIPAVFATNEDIDLFRRLSRRGIPIEVYLKVINALTTSTSRNIMGDYLGKSKANEFVLLAGHTDSWFSEGAQDDGVGVALTLEIPKLLKQLNLTPKRTLRSILFTAEEPGAYGSRKYVKAHAAELSRYSALIDADGGCYKILGYSFPKKFNQFGCILHEILKLQEQTIGARVLMGLEVREFSDFPNDGYPFARKHVPGAVLFGDDEKQRFFWYWHTLGDTVSIVKSDQLDRCLALAASTAYILADLTDLVQRH